MVLVHIGLGTQWSDRIPDILSIYLDHSVGRREDILVVLDEHTDTKTKDSVLMFVYNNFIVQ